VIQKRVKIHGGPKAVSRQLNDFLSSLKTPTRIMPYSTVRSVSLVIDYKEKDESWSTVFSDPLPLATCLPLQIFDAIRAMCNLRSLTLIIDKLNERQESLFYGLLQNIKIQAEYLQISASDRITRRVLENSPQLQALHLPETIDITKFEPVVGRLRRLCAVVGPVKSSGRIQFPTINEVNLIRIASRYQNLEELVLHTVYENYGDEDSAVMFAFEKNFAKAINVFRSMPGLKRLAINIDEDTARTFGNTSVQEDRFYIDRLLRLATCLPRLVQIGITNDMDRYWTVTKTSYGELTIGRGAFSFQDVGFPESVNERFY
ncbi:unnamed protein product, partial [Clonostachys byssicola]